MAKKQWQYILDPNILECPICSEPFSPPVYQCENGHILCSTCSEKITKCPSCSQPIRRIRNLAMEQIIDTLQVQCKHPGCDKMVKYTERKQHEGELCDYYPIRCPCPLPYQCKHTGPRAWLQLHCFSSDDGYYLYCTACGVSKEVAYKLIVEVLALNIKSEKRLHVYSMQTVANTVANIQQQDNGFLIIPHKMAESAESSVTLSVL